MTSGRVMYWMPNADLRNRHDGLAIAAKKEFKVDVDKLKPGEMIMFINTAWTQFALFCAGNVLLHYKRPDGKHLNKRALMLVPQFMIGQKIDYTKALRVAIEKEYQQKHPRLFSQQE